MNPIPERALGNPRQRIIKAETRETLQAADIAKKIDLSVLGRVTAWSTDNGRLEVNDGTGGGTGGSWSAAGGAGSSVTLDGAYDNGGAGVGRTINVDTGSVRLLDTQDSSSATLEISSSTGVVGAANKWHIDIASTSANTTTGQVGGIKVDLSGATFAGVSPDGVQVIMAANTQDAFYASVGGLKLDNGNLAVTGTSTLTGAVTATSDVTMSGGTLDITETAAQTTLAVTNNAVTTQVLAQIDSTSVTSGVGFRVSLDDTAVTSGAYLQAWDSDAGAEVFSVKTGGNTAVAGTLGVTGAATLSSTLAVTGNATFSADITAENGTLSLKPNGTGDTALQIEPDAAGGFTEPVVKWIYSERSGTNADHFIEGIVSGAAGGATDGNFLDLECQLATYRGTLASLDLGTSTVATGALVVGGAAARTGNLLQLTDAGTSTGNCIDVQMSSTSSGRQLSLTYAGAATGDAIYVLMENAGVGAQALVVDDGNRAFTSNLIDITATGAAGPANAHVVSVTIDGANFTAGNAAYRAVASAAAPAHLFSGEFNAAGAGNGLDLDYGNGATGDAVNIALTATGGGAAVGAQALVVTNNSVARTSTLIQVTDDAAANGDSFSIAKSGAGTGSNVLLQNTSATAAPGKVLDVDYNAALTAAVGSVARFRSHTATWDAAGGNAREVVLIQADHVNGTAADDSALRITSTSSAKALHVDSGLSVFDEAVGFGGTVPSATEIILATLAAGDSVRVDSATTANTASAVSVEFDSDTDNAAAVHVVSSGTSPASATVSGVFVDQTGGVDALGASGVYAGVRIALEGNAGDDAASDRYGILIEDLDVAMGAGSATGINIGDGNATAFDIAINMQGKGLIQSEDVDLELKSIADSSGDAPDVRITAADGNTEGDGGLVAITSGDGTSAGGAAQHGGQIAITCGDGANGGDGGDLTIVVGQENGGGTAGTLTVQGSDGAAGAENWLVADRTATPPLQVANSMAPTKWDWVSAQEMRSHTSATEENINDLPSKQFTDAVVGTDIVVFSWRVPYDFDATNSTVIVELVWTAADGAGAGDVVWILGHKARSAGELTNASFTNLADAADTKTAQHAHEEIDMPTISGGTFAAGDVVYFRVQRDGGDAADTLAESVNLLGARVRYTGALTP